MKRSAKNSKGGLLKEFLDEKVELYNQPSFISSDPVSIPHQYSLPEDIEISAFFAATLSWGKRSTIISKSELLMKLMGNSPYDFVMSANANDLKRLDNFVHRTFNSSDAKAFISVLRKLYKEGGLKCFFMNHETMYERISNLHLYFEKNLPVKRTLKHVSSPSKGSAAKRINMFCRWMVRNDNKGVDFGLWREADPGELICPLDVHSGNVARKLGLLKRTQNDWNAAMELTENLRKLDSKDPVKYDFALFGLGVFEKF